MAHAPTDLALRSGAAEIMERVLLAGDLSKLSAAERVAYYRETCGSLDLNPLTKPFDYITLNGKLTLYATRTATDQLRAKRGVSVRLIDRRLEEGVFAVTAQASTPDGRVDESTGAVSVAGLRGDALANAYMKAETKAKRRVTLSICGLGWMDETETETVRGATRTAVSHDTGEIVEVLPVERPADHGTSNGAAAGAAERRYTDCTECGNPVTDAVNRHHTLITRSDGTPWTAAEVERKSREVFSRPLCYACLRTMPAPGSEASGVEHNAVPEAGA